MFDCGEGTQRQLQRSLGLVHLDSIFLTHLHADHFLGLPGLLKTYDLNDRREPLAVYGPPGLVKLVAALESEELRQVTLVGHSYGGMVITGVAARAAARLSHLVYLDAFVPEVGQAMLDYSSRAQVIR